MPSPDGRPVTVPALPWQQVFKPGDTVRVIDGIDFGAGEEGLVVFHDQASILPNKVMVDLSDGGIFNFAPGELRPVTA